MRARFGRRTPVWAIYCEGAGEVLKGRVVHQGVREVLALLLANDTGATFGLGLIALRKVSVQRGWGGSTLPTLILRRRQFLQPFLDFLWDLRGLYDRDSSIVL